MKQRVFYLIGFLLVILLTGCVQKADKTDKLRDLEFTVVEKETIPKELKTAIDANKEEPIKLTYADKGYLYIAQGYGAQPTSGYSVEVTEVFETENAVYIHTNLLGPAKEERIEEAVTYPYVVIKLELIEKNVVFE